MPHFYEYNTSSTMVQDGRENTALVNYDHAGIGEPVFLELPYRSTAAVIPGPDSLGRMGQAHNLDPATFRVVAQIVGPIGETSLGGEPVALATTQTHSESTTYFVQGVRGELRNGGFTATTIVWTYDSRKGITGNPEGLVDGVYLLASSPMQFQVGWGGAL